MSSKKNRRAPPRMRPPASTRRRPAPLVIEKVEYVDYKDVDLLSRFMSDRAKIRNRRVSGNDVQQQRDVASAIKLAREMALLPYAKRVSSQRTRPPRDGRRDRDDATLDVSDGTGVLGDDVIIEDGAEFDGEVFDGDAELDESSSTEERV